jgi:predicted O-methyltransferase YrrM
MDDTVDLKPPSTLDAIHRDSATLGFSMASEDRTGALLRTLVASKPGGAFLELGTGTGIATAWILDGMDSASTLLTVENEERFANIARRHLGHDRRVSFQIEDAKSFLSKLGGRKFDLIFADTWSGKFDHLDKALDLLHVGAFYVIDDLLPQTNWPEGHAPRVPVLISQLERDPRLMLCKFAWSSGIIVAARRADQDDSRSA